LKKRRKGENGIIVYIIILFRSPRSLKIKRRETGEKWARIIIIII